MDWHINFSVCIGKKPVCSKGFKYWTPLINTGKSGACSRIWILTKPNVRPKTFSGSLTTKKILDCVLARLKKIQQEKNTSAYTRPMKRVASEQALWILVNYCYGVTKR